MLPDITFINEKSTLLRHMAKIKEKNKVIRPLVEGISDIKKKSDI